MTRLYYNPLLEDDEDDFPTDNRSSWERFIEGLDMVSKMSADDWFDQLDKHCDPF